MLTNGGTCTLAIVMLNFFHEKKDKPPGLDGYHSPRDMATFYELWQAADQLERVCLLHSGQPGWAAEGM